MLSVPVENRATYLRSRLQWCWVSFQHFRRFDRRYPAITCWLCHNWRVTVEANNFINFRYGAASVVFGSCCDISEFFLCPDAIFHSYQQRAAAKINVLRLLIDRPPSSDCGWDVAAGWRIGCSSMVSYVENCNNGCRSVVSSNRDCCIGITSTCWMLIDE